MSSLRKGTAGWDSREWVKRSPRPRMGLAWGAAALLTLCSLPVAPAQVGGAARDTANRDTGDRDALKPNPVVALRDFETPVGQPYVLGRGDLIAIDIAGRPELSGKQAIGPDGRITLPLAGSMLLADLTREQAAAAVVKAYDAYYSDLHVTVGVDKYTSNQVLLLGAVEHPGVQTFDRAPTLLEVVTRGGALAGSSGEGVSGDRGGGGGAGERRNTLPGIPAQVSIYRGSDKMITVDLKQLLENGSPLADLRLKRDDIVYVPSASERVISVLGQVQHPGAFPLDSRTTLSSLLAFSGGLTVEAGRYPDIQIISPSTNKTRVVSFKQVLQPGPLELTLYPGDVVYVPESGFNRAAYVIEKLSPLVTVFTASALITH